MNRLVLLVEDNPTNAKLERVLLENAGFEVMLAVDAEQALAALATRRPGLILMDLQLPGTDGFTLTYLIRSTPDFADLPIVAVTAYAMNGDESTTLEAGFNGYVTKPINTRTFVETVTQYLQRNVPNAPQ